VTRLGKAKYHSNLLGSWNSDVECDSVRRTGSRGGRWQAQNKTVPPSLSTHDFISYPVLTVPCLCALARVRKQ